MYELKQVGDISILHLFGEVSLAEMEKIQEIFKSLRQTSSSKILLDLSQVDHIHFRAVERWALEAIDLQKNEGGLKLVAPNREAKHILQFTGADQFLEDYFNLSEAILSFLNQTEATDEKESLQKLEINEDDSWAYH